MTTLSTTSNLEYLAEAFPAHREDLRQIAREANGGELIASLRRLHSEIGQGRAQQGVEGRFVGDLIEHLARPGQTINQGNDITCSQTACMWYLAKSDKAEFIRVCSELAIKGEVVLNGKQRLVIAAGSLEQETRAETGQFDPRSQVEKLFQRSLMQANSSNFRIIDEKGVERTVKGTSLQQTVDQMTQITGQLHIGVADKRDLDQVYSRISSFARRKDLESLNREFGGTQAALNWSERGKDVVHDAAIDHFEIGNDGELYVSVFHGWGKFSRNFDEPTIARDENSGLELMSFKEYKRRCITLVLNTEKDTVKALNLRSSVEAVGNVIFLTDGSSIVYDYVGRINHEKKQKAQMQEDDDKRRAIEARGREEFKPIRPDLKSQSKRKGNDDGIGVVNAPAEQTEGSISTLADLLLEKK